MVPGRPGENRTPIRGFGDPCSTIKLRAHEKATSYKLQATRQTDRAELYQVPSGSVIVVGEADDIGFLGRPSRIRMLPDFGDEPPGFGSHQAMSHEDCMGEQVARLIGFWVEEVITRVLNHLDRAARDSPDLRAAIVVLPRQRLTRGDEEKLWREHAGSGNMLICKKYLDKSSHVLFIKTEIRTPWFLDILFDEMEIELSGIGKRRFNSCLLRSAERIGECHVSIIEHGL